MKHLTETPRVESNWEVLKSCIWKAGEEIIGRERINQPDWLCLISKALNRVQ